MKVEEDFKMNHTLLKLFLECVELFRKDYSLLIEANGYQTIRRTRKHIRNMRKLLKEMNKLIEYRNVEVIELKWGGKIPMAAKRKQKSESEPLIL